MSRHGARGVRASTCRSWLGCARRTPRNDPLPGRAVGSSDRDQQPVDVHGSEQTHAQQSNSCPSRSYRAQRIAKRTASVKTNLYVVIMLHSIHSIRSVRLCGIFIVKTVKDHHLWEKKLEIRQNLLPSERRIEPPRFSPRTTDSKPVLLGPKFNFTVQQENVNRIEK
jgi:hypothetical protein